MLELEAISTRYGTVSMLQGVSLQVPEGQIVCLLGPNGAGKSTTFKAIARLLPLHGGRIRLLGRDVSGARTEALAPMGVGFVPEGRRLFAQLSVRDNLQTGYDALRPHDPFETALQRIVGMFPRVGERLNRAAGTLSGGEQAMVALGRALIGRPRLLVMDEPTLGLSPLLIEEYFQTVRRVNQEGITVLLIEQNAEAALSIAHRGYLLQKGRMVAAGSARELLDNDVVRHLYL